ncbi:hypothetical protein C5167_027333 [Papaver somniferum]|nr:hypothetical protein C5167_027333 [Papaver somniferum]
MSDSKTETPFAKAGLLSRLSFWWLNPLIRKGKHKNLEDDDIPMLRNSDRASTCYMLFMQQQQLQQPQSILWAIVHCYWKEIAISGLCALLKIWALILQICLGLAVLVHAVGLATPAALVVIVLTVLVNIPIGKFQTKYQRKLMGVQNRRLKAMSEALMNMKILKLYAWEIHFKNVIENLRNEEYKWLLSMQYQKAVNGFLLWASPVMVAAATFWACYFLKVPLNPSNVFTFIATLRIVQDPMKLVPDVISVVIQTKVSFERIKKFLATPELESEKVRHNGNDEEQLKHSIFIESANFSWEENPIKYTLSNIHLEVKPGEKVAICGEVGAGKSTLLAAILGEVPYIKGTIQVYGTMAYVSQTAWMQSGSIQENILFGCTLDKKTYQDVLEKCSLLKDLEMLPYGDLTEIGERGINLSGGQKQRIQLARALYQDADMYLLDDPFSAVDAHTATSLFNEYVMGALSGKTVLLVTHQVDFLPAFDYVLLMSDGEIQHASPYHTLLASSSVFYDLVNAHKDTAGNERLVKSSKSLFSQLLNSLFHAPISFYESTPLGRLLSRVSSDLSIVDLDIAFNLIFAIVVTANTYITLGVLTVITWQVVFVCIPIAFSVIYLQGYYSASAKEFMRINGTTKSMLIDKNASPSFHIYSANEWFIQRLETLSVIVLCSSALLLVLLPQGTFSSGFVGMALSYGLSLNMTLVFSTQIQCILANNIISVERLSQYMKVPSEAPEVIEGTRPVPSWPASGRVELHDLKIRYRADTPLVLQGITCTFEEGHKIGIVGRTGSGKTTLISALFRIVEPTGGKIVIDGIDISTIGLHDLRLRLGIIPQDPTRFKGTVRYNLDPLSQHNDQEIWEVLEKCHLRDTVQEKKEGLSSLGISTRWCKLEHGTTTTILLGASSFEEKSDIESCTVITVAHRIPTVMDSTLVLAISDGKIVEYDEPTKLMNEEGSLFGELVKEYCSYINSVDS